MTNSLNQDLQSAIKLREEGKLLESGRSFATLLNQIKKSDPLYTTLVAEYIIQLRLEAASTLGRALTLAQETFTSDQHHKINNPMSYRSVSHVLTELGGYELAEPILRQICTMYPHNSLRLGESQAHLAHTLLRTGKITEARSLIDQALENIRENSAHEDYLEVREAHALITYSLILSALGDRSGAKAMAQQALAIAKQGQAVFRIQQAEELLKLFS